MGKIYSAPKEIAEPEFHVNGEFNMDAYNEDTERYRKEVADYAKKYGKGKLAGKIVSFPIADGSASYVVFSSSPVQLLHLADGDAYQFPYANRLTASDIKERIGYDEAMVEIFRKCK